jgi:hypothetical protein
MRTSTILNARDYLWSKFSASSLDQEQGQPEREQKGQSMRSATASLCQSILLPFRRVFSDEGEEDHLDDQRDYRGQDAAYRIAEHQKKAANTNAAMGEKSTLYFSTITGLI